MTTVNQTAVLSTPRLFIRVWTATKSISFGAGKKIVCASRSRNLSSIFGTAWLDYREQLATFNSTIPKGTAGLRGFTKDDFEIALHEYIESAAEAALKVKCDEIKCTEGNLAPLQIFMKACTGKSDQKELAVMAQFIWLIKRKMLGLKASDHIMPAFYGKQHAGKSTAVSLLIECISDWRSDIKIDELTDSRNGYSLQENFVVVFDEMQNASKADIDVLKNRITADRFACRRLKTNIVDQLSQNCSFIGTTNKYLDEQIVDSTGMRRFYQINTLDKMDWEAINSLDYLALWRGVDEKLERGYLKPFEKEILKAQEPLCATDLIYEFISEHKLNEFEVGKDDVSAGALYGAYRYWCQSNGCKPLDSNWFGRRLRNRGIDGGKNADGQRIYRVNKNSIQLITFSARKFNDRSAA